MTRILPDQDGVGDGRLQNKMVNSCSRTSYLIVNVTKMENRQKTDHSNEIILHCTYLFNIIKIESDSDFVNEQLTGNIHKIAIVPLNFTGRPKKGHLIFDACFECGKK